MGLLRAFIAIEIPTEIKKAISAQTASLQKDAVQTVRWVAPDNLHLTLKFLGEISPANVEFLSAAIKAECERHHPFEVVVEKLGCFPNSRHPRVIWIGLGIPQELNHLQSQVEAVAAQLGYPPEERPFSPHLTIGRIREQAASTEIQSLRSLLEKTTIGTLGTFTARAVHLFRSDLQPGGPKYSLLASAPLL